MKNATKLKSAYVHAIEHSPRVVALKACAAASNALLLAVRLYRSEPTDANRDAMSAADRALMAAQATAHTR